MTAYFFIYFFSFFCAIISRPHVYFFVTGVTFFSNIKSFYEIIFLNFIFSTRSQSYRKIMKMQEISIVFYLMWQTKTVQ